MRPRLVSSFAGFRNWVIIESYNSKIFQGEATEIETEIKAHINTVNKT